MTESLVIMANEDTVHEDLQSVNEDLSTLNLEAQTVSNGVEVSNLLPDTEAESKTH